MLHTLLNYTRRTSKKLWLSFAAISLILSANASASEPAAKHYTPLPEIYDGSMMPYDFNLCTPAEIPDSLTPFFIDYVGRHGARFLSSEKKVSRLTAAIEKAREAKKLTPLGEEMAQLIDLVKATTAGHWGALDSVGCNEQQRLGKQMAEMWPGVTAYGSITAKSTYVPRVVMSMYQFSHSLGATRPQLNIYTAEGHIFDPLLRFFDTDSININYLKEKPWSKIYDEFVSKNISDTPARALFGDTFDKKESQKLTLDIYGVIQSLRAAGLPAPDTRWMSEKEYRACWEASNLEHYYARTQNVLSSIPSASAAPLLKELIYDADEVIINADTANKGKNDLRAALFFGHAETLMPLLSLCDVEGCNAPDIPTDKVSEVWRDYDIVPLGANFEIVFMRAPSGTVYALTRLNGKDVTVGRFSSPIVPWLQLRTFWLNRISSQQ